MMLYCVYKGAHFSCPAQISPEDSRRFSRKEAAAENMKTLVTVALLCLIYALHLSVAGKYLCFISLWAVDSSPVLIVFTCCLQFLSGHILCSNTVAQTTVGHLFVKKTWSTWPSVAATPIYLSKYDQREGSGPFVTSCPVKTFKP